MPISTLISLIPENDAILRPTMGHHAHAAFLDIIHQTNPKLAKKLHAPASHKPFTVSPLIAKTTRNENRLHIRAGTDCKLRYTFLDDELFAHFGRSFLTQALPTIRLGNATFVVKQLVSHTQSTDQTIQTVDWSGNTTYNALIQNAKADREIHFKFYSPTAFRILTPKGQKSDNYAQVDTVRCYQSWLNKWNAFSPVQFNKEECLSFITEHVRVSRTDTRTQALNFGKHTEIGWVGTCSFRFIHKERLDENLLRIANCLADFARYCGTGYKTTMGMGQTRRI